MDHQSTVLVPLKHNVFRASSPSEATSHFPYFPHFPFNASRAETGRFPMTIAPQSRNFRLWLTLTKNEYKLPQIACNDIKWKENKAFWSKKIKSLLKQIGLGDLWMKAHYVDIGIVTIIRQRLKDIELQRWLSEINNNIRKDVNQSNEMRTYQLFKTIDNCKCEDYLHQVTNTRHRIALTKLRLSNHKLAIETGRYSRPSKKPAERTCPICKIEMEDEYHFLYGLLTRKNDVRY